MEFIGFHSPFAPAELFALLGSLTVSGTPIERRGFADSSVSIFGVSNGRHASPDTLCFVDRPPAPEAVPALKQAVLLTTRELAVGLAGFRLIVVDDPRALFIDFVNDQLKSQAFHCFSSLVTVAPGIHSDADVHAKAVIEDGVHIGPGSRIASGCVIKSGTCLGSKVIVRENTVIGADGIALYKARDGRVLRFPHLAGVVVGDGVEIGASCCLSGGVMNATKIGVDTVIGNLCNLGHGVDVGAKVWMSVGCMIGGNTAVGEQSTLGLSVSIRDNVRVGKNCSIGMGSVVVNDLPDGHSVFGNPARRLPDVNAGPNR